MTSFVDLTANQPTRSLQPGDVLISEGDPGGDLYVLLLGELAVERDGVKLASLSNPGALLGEMSVLLGIKSSATVRAVRETRVRVVKDAAKVLEHEPVLALRLAATVANRLDATSGLLVEMSREHSGTREQGLLSRIMAALHVDEDPQELSRPDLFNDPGLWPRGPM